ncbi:DUF4130 domain-containing protein [Candidatus Woesearchaeota archaeon]|jgi:probable DNA metabolism protein|nr:DUF4130 domain-containing protein [Candidatus Woesearchaeota archaeon]
MNPLEDMFNLASRHKNFKQPLLNKVKAQDIRLVQNLATPEARQLYKLHRQVGRETHLKTGFMRFESSPNGILFGKTRLEHNTLDLILNHFTQRFPIFHIAIQLNGKTFVQGPKIKKTFNFELGATIKHLELMLPVNPILSELNFEENNIWEKFYDSQYIGQRRNLRLQRQMMPFKYRDSIFETAKSKRSNDLRSYF